MISGDHVGIFQRLKFKPGSSRHYDSAAAYQRHLDSKLKLHKDDRDLAFADAVGSVSVELFKEQGDAHVKVLRHHGLRDGMSIFDLGCGCGRTAQALQRSGWQGNYTGTDIVGGFIDELKRKCPGYDAYVHQAPTIRAEGSSLDMVYHWSVFTHLAPEECFLYVEDSFRALKPGGKLVFSFLEFTEPLHRDHFMNRVRRVQKGKDLNLLDTFLHRDWIALWAQQIGFADIEFTDGDDGSRHPPFWQTLVSMVKPNTSM
jgi:ubiquinone/menaquinone biosynthesis C-methylase UbiE